MKKIIIALDGYAATGKSTQAKKLAHALGYTYIDSGAMYRAVTLFGLQQSKDKEIDLDGLVRSLAKIDIRFEYNEEGQQTFLNGQNVSSAIREVVVNNQVSQIATLAPVRSFLVEQQQRMGMDKGIVMDGRDIGTVVFPSAECKFFLTASPEIRAQRRYKEQIESGISESYKDVLENVKKRDHQDRTRKATPLKKAADAIEIDVSNLTIDQVFNKIKREIDLKLKTLKK
jgi:cytidylate kinase